MRAQKALSERKKNSKDFADTLSQMGLIETEEEEEEEFNASEMAIEYDECQNRPRQQAY